MKAADYIIMMEKGQIIREGRHERLPKQGGHHATLYHIHVRHESLKCIPDWVDDKVSGRLRLDVTAGEEGKD